MDLVFTSRPGFQDLRKVFGLLVGRSCSSDLQGWPLSHVLCFAAPARPGAMEEMQKDCWAASVRPEPFFTFVFLCGDFLVLQRVLLPILCPEYELVSRHAHADTG